MQQQQQQQLPAHPLPSRTTPGRRRGANRQFGHSPGRKNYASENDMPTSTDYPFALELISPQPLTPQRQPKNSPGPASQPSNPRSKPRTTSKLKQKQASASPEEPKYGRTTPPQSVMPKSAAVAAFAGATFHASPAPSSLPIPSFFAKAPDSPLPVARDLRRENLEPSPPPTDTEPPTPQHRVLSSKENSQEESPLDIFFRADRAEKERARRASSANIFSTIPRPFSPPRQAQSPQEARTLPNGAGSLRARRPAGPLRITSSGISSVELDGTPGKPIGPSFSTPYQERIQAARSGQKANQQHFFQEKTPPTSPPEQDGVSEELSDKLKRYLAIPSEPKDGNIQQTRPVTTSTITTTTTMTTASTTFTSTSSGAQPVYGRHPTGHVLDMENTLRRMLKIDAGISLGNAGAAPASYQSS
ncbi:hypothetical protein V8F06_008134 [Rhypophila decipiens]